MIYIYKLNQTFFEFIFKNKNNIYILDNFFLNDKNIIKIINTLEDFNIIYTKQKDNIKNKYNYLYKIFDFNKNNKDFNRDFFFKSNYFNNYILEKLKKVIKIKYNNFCIEIPFYFILFIDNPLFKYDKIFQKYFILYLKIYFKQFLDFFNNSNFFIIIIIFSLIMKNEIYDNIILINNKKTESIFIETYNINIDIKHIYYIIKIIN